MSDEPRIQDLFMYLSVGVSVKITKPLPSARDYDYDIALNMSKMEADARRVPFDGTWGVIGSGGTFTDALRAAIRSQKSWGRMNKEAKWA